MFSQTVQWVVLPAGTSADGQILRLSVLVAPQLRTDEGDTLASFPDFVDWPTRIAGASLGLLLNGVGPVPATLVGDAPDSTLWQALFPPETTVVPYAFDDFADRPMVTYAASMVGEQLRRLYTRVAAAGPAALPRLRSDGRGTGLDELLGAWRDAIGQVLFEGNDDDFRRRIVADRLAGARERSRGLRADPERLARRGALIEPFPPDGSPAGELARLAFFHLRGEAEPVPLPPDGDDYRGRIDVHQLFGALGDHRWLARRLGLVLDLEVARADVADADQGGPRFLGVAPGAIVQPDRPITDLVPATGYVLGDVAGLGTMFTAARTPAAGLPLTPPAGMVPLPATPYALHQVDLDGAALKALGLAVTVSRPASPAAQQPLHQPDDAGLPALRTSGVALVHAGRATELQNEFVGQLTANDAHTQGTPVQLFAEQLVRGYRLDVLDAATGTWRSLHQRRTDATAERYPGILDPVLEDGFLTVSVASAPVAAGAAPDPSAELYVHEALVSWDGWSLSAPRPGQTLSEDAANTPTTVANTAFTTLGLSLQASAVPGTLPRLRFGRSYQVRLRSVDLAGQGATLAEADAQLAAGLGDGAVLPPAPQPYLRFEPVPAPAVATAQRFDEGASLLRLVVRSDRERDPATWAGDLNASPLVAGGAHPAYTADDQRHLAPPKAAFELVERHGQFDPVIGAAADGTPVPASLAEVRQAYEIARQEKGSLDDPDAPDAEPVEIAADPLHPAQRYVIRHDAQLEIPYLPDPLAEGVVLFGLPGTAEPYEISFAADPWYRARPFRLRLVAGDGQPAWDEAARVLTVSLPQASTARVQVASVLRRLDLMGVLAWCEKDLAGADLDTVVDAAKQNRCWLLTPWHDLQLVHAVQRPLSDPELELLELSRAPGATFVDLHGICSVDVPSTDKIDLEAEWTEPVDDVALGVPGPQTKRAHVFDLALAEVARHRNGHPDDDPYTLQDGRRVTFWTAFARRERLATPIAHDFGDTRHRIVRYLVVATTPFRENFPLAWADQPDLLTAASAPVELNVLSSARPVAPKVLYVLPTQGWERSDDGVTAVATRRGGGLRVWLGRSWWSSGDGELLGVLLREGIADTDEQRFRTLVAQDPIRAGATLHTAKPAMFRGWARLDRVKLPEAPGGELPDQPGPFTVAGYAPAFDAETDRWYCDISLDTGQAYFPFVRLALVRYQPDSLAGCHLSRVLLADIVQTLPDRTATLVRDPADLGTVQVSVTGPGYTAIRGAHGVQADPAARARVRVQVEQADPAVADEVLRWQPTADAPVTLTETVGPAGSTWIGSVPVPATGVPQRLLVTEEDVLATDSGVDPSELISRVVFAATFEM